MNNNIKKDDTNNTTLEIKVLLSDIWRGFVKFGWIAVVLAIVLGGIQFYRSYVRFTPVYTVNATFTVHTENEVLAGDNNASAYSFFYDKNTASQFQAVFPSVINNSVLQKLVCLDLGVSSVPASVTATCIDDTSMVTLTAIGSDAKLTYDTLQSVIKNYSAVGDYIIGRTKLVMIDEPILPNTPSNSMAWRSSVFRAALIGFVLGLGWIILYAILRKTIRTRDDIRNLLNQHCIGVLPQVIFKKYRRKINTDIIITNSNIGTDFVDSLRLMKGAFNKRLEEGEKIVVITSTAPDEGKSVVTVNLAAELSKNGGKVLVVDCDLRNLGTTELIGGLSSFRTRVKENEIYSIRKIDTLGFHLLSFNGERHLQSIVRTHGLKAMFSELKDEYDVILIDTPPCGMISDASIIAGAADAVMYIIRQDAVLQSSIRTGINSMLDTDARFLGCILNGATGGFGGYGSYYKYGGYHKYYRYGKGKKYGGYHKHYHSSNSGRYGY